MITLAEIEATGLPLEDHGALAAALSVGRTKLGSISREGFATWAARTGVREKIEDYSQSAGHPLRSVALSLIDVLRSPTAGIDFSSPDNLNMLGAWVALGEITQAQADELIAAATTPDPVSSQEVTRALEGL